MNQASVSQTRAASISSKISRFRQDREALPHLHEDVTELGLRIVNIDTQPIADAKAMAKKPLATRFDIFAQNFLCEEPESFYIDKILLRPELNIVHVHPSQCPKNQF